MLNEIILMGRLAYDPKLKYTENNIAFIRFSLAVKRDYKDKGSESVTDFIDIIAWRSTAEFISKYFSKGKMIIVKGSLQINNWTDNNGNKRKSAEVIADKVYFGESKNNDVSQSYNSEYPIPDNTKIESISGELNDPDEINDLPF